MPTILVVDDEPAVRELVVEVLRLEGYAAVGAADGRAALAALERVAPALVLMDVMMPGLDGRGAYLAMRARPAGAAVPVVLMSAAADPARLPPGAAAFLAKPFDLDELLGLVARLLAEGPDPPP
jgi:CheY-like chemotaxis protein